MADVAKGAADAQHTVSSGDCDLPVVCGELTSAGSLSDLSLPGPEEEDQSLQDLIESELALRISQSADLDLDLDLDLDRDVNTRFILAERNHSFHAFTGNDTFFFSTLEETPPSNGDADAVSTPPSSPCPPVLGAVFDPFTSTIVEQEWSPSADSELVCLSQDLAGDPDPSASMPDDDAVLINLECSVPTNPPFSPLTIPEIDVIPPEDDDDGCSSEDEEEAVSSVPQALHDQAEEEWTTVAEAVGPERAESPEPDLHSPEDAEYHLQDTQEEQAPAPCHTPDQAAGHTLVDILHASQDDSESSSSSSSESDLDDPALKKTKKKRSDGGDQAKPKKSKKKKGSDTEKENISVITNGHDDQAAWFAADGHGLEDADSHAEHSCSDSAAAEDDLSNVSVRELKSVLSQAACQPAAGAAKQMDEDLSLCGPIQLLKQTYCSEASKSFGRPEGADKEVIATGISIKDLRRSFGDLTEIGDDELDQVAVDNVELDDERSGGRRCGAASASRATSWDAKWRTRSLGDLRTPQLGEERATPGAPDHMLHIFTGVSVKSLRASYCSLVHLDDRPVTRDMLLNTLKSSFSKFDQLSKKSVLHVRSVDAAKVQKQFNQTAAAAPEQTTNCRSCGKQVFQMEQIKAERAVWHKNCFRCKECNKQLTVDIYSSHEGQLYCKPHFRELFKPKAVLDDEHEMPRLRRHEMIIRENQPIELPPEVVRASDKPDLGLEELSSLNVKSRFQVFEKATDEQAEVERSPSAVNVKRSPSILSKLARFQAKGMDVGVTDESLNGIPFEESSSSSEEEEEDEEADDRGVVRSSKKNRERPVSFSKMEDIKCRETVVKEVKSRKSKATKVKNSCTSSHGLEEKRGHGQARSIHNREELARSRLLEDIRARWETGQAARKENLREERKHEISNIRSRLFMGHQGKMKEMYEQAVQESERSTQKKGVDIKSERARTIKEKFERGEVVPDDDPDVVREDITRKAKEEDLSVVEAGISKKSRSLFLELDATAAKTQQPLLPASPVKTTPSFREDTRKLFMSQQTSQDVVRSSDTVKEVKVETEEVSNKFKFFEGYKPPEKQKKQFRITPPRDGQVKAESPEREIYRDPTVVRCEDKVEDDGELVARSHTTSKMLSLFRQLEENANKEELPDGPKPLKRFTPPPDYTHESESSEEESESEEDEDEEEDERINPNVVRASDKVEDEFLKQAQNAARAKVLRAKFERWEEKENKANITNMNNHVNGVDVEREGEHQTSIDTTKSLRARFESFKHEVQQPKERTHRPKVNRFVVIQTTCAEFCSSCEKKVYPLERVETGGKIFHKQCFRCQQCKCILRMETYTLNGGKPYCLPHFKQLFIAKGNYDEGFGLDQHKRKWKTSTRGEDDILLNGMDGEASS